MPWRPAQPNGWNVRIQRYRDRILLVYGSGEVWVAELTLDLQRVDERRLDAANAYAVGWIGPGIAAWQRFDGEKDLTKTDLVTASYDEDWRVQERFQSLYAGGAAACDGGHLLTYLAAPYFQASLDGTVVAVASGGAPTMAWPWAAHAASNDNNAIKVYQDGALSEVLGAPVGFNALKIGPRGHIAYGYPWLVGLALDGTLTDLSVAPCRSEAPFKILDLDGQPWLVTSSWDGVDAQLLLRPWRAPTAPVERRAWKIPIPVSGGDLIEDGASVLVAVHDDRGALLVDRFPKQPLTVLEPVVAPLPDRWAGYYYAAGRYGDFQPAQNCTMIARSMFADASGVQPADTDVRFAQAILNAGRVFADPADIPVVAAFWDRVAGIIIGETSGPAETKAIASKARATMAAWKVPQRPIVATVMVSQQTDPGWHDAADWLGLECYLDAPGPGNWWETQPAIARQLDRAGDVFGTKPVLLIGQAYDRNGAWTNQDTLEAIQPALVTALRRDYVRGVLWFAYGRPGGTKDHPALEQWHRATVAATRAPDVETITGGGTMPDRPRITIDPNYTKTGASPLTVTARAIVTGGPWTAITWSWQRRGGARFTKNDDTSTTIVLTEPGIYDLNVAIEGPGGTDHTGQSRVIEVTTTAPPPPPPPPPPRGIGDVMFQSDNGHFLTAHEGPGDQGARAGDGRPKGLAVCDRDQAALDQFGTGWQATTVEPQPDGRLAIRLDDRYLTAWESETTHEAVFNRASIGEGELWRGIAMPDGRVALQAYNGLFLVAEGGGGGAVTVRKPGNADGSPGAWESWTTSKRITSGGSVFAGRRGNVRTQGLNFVDDAGNPFKVHGVAGFQGFQHWLNGERGKLEDFAGWARAYGVNTWSFLCQWRVTGFDPRSYGARYQDEIPNWLDWLDQQGFYPWPIAYADQVNGSPILMSGAEQDAHRDMWIRWLAGKFLEWMNEPYQNGIDVARRMPNVPGIIAARGAWADGSTPTSVGGLLQMTTQSFGRKPDWQRTAKDLAEAGYLGMGDNGPATRLPPVGREPPLGVFHALIQWSRSNDPRSFADWHAVADVLGSGSHMHGDLENLQSCTVPEPVADACCAAIAVVWKDLAEFMADPSTCHYTRGPNSDCPLVHSDRFDPENPEREIDAAGAERTFSRIDGGTAINIPVQYGAAWSPRTQGNWQITERRGPQEQIVLTRR